MLKMYEYTVLYKPNNQYQNYQVIYLGKHLHMHVELDISLAGANS